MKFVTVVLFCLCNGLLFAQDGKDTIENVIANWNKGETWTMAITRTKEKIESGKPAPPFKFLYKAVITVLDSSADGYKMRWVFQLDEDFKNQNPGIEKAMPVYNGLEFLYTTTESGEFKDLLNWEEVRDGYVEMAMVSMPERRDIAVDAALEQVKAMFSTKQLVEAALIKEIQLYHLPYGGQFNTRRISSAQLLPNPFGGEPMPATATQYLTSSKDGRSYTVTFLQELDSSGTHILMESVFKAMKIPMDSVYTHVNEMLENFKVSDLSHYRVLQPGNWITEIRYSRIANAGEMKQVEEFKFSMIR